MSCWEHQIPFVLGRRFANVEPGENITVEQLLQHSADRGQVFQEQLVLHALRELSRASLPMVRDHQRRI